MFKNLRSQKNQVVLATEQQFGIYSSKSTTDNRLNESSQAPYFGLHKTKLFGPTDVKKLVLKRRKETKVSAKVCANASLAGKLVLDRKCNLHIQNTRNNDPLCNRLVQFGHKAMEDRELLELLLFDSSPITDAKDFAQRLLDTFGDLSGVVAASEHQLLKVDGATREVYLLLRIVSAFAQRMGQLKVLNREIVSCWKELIEYCRVSMAYIEVEQFRVFYLDTKNAIIADEEQATGTVNHVPVYPREILKRALELNANALILVHNHPSGDPTPSEEDIHMTKTIVKACDTIGLIVHDHIVIGKEAEFSCRAAGFLDI